jgi:hypothetical protein
VSPDGLTASIFWNANGLSDFNYAVAGGVVVKFEALCSDRGSARTRTSF